MWRRSVVALVLPGLFFVAGCAGQESEAQLSIDELQGYWWLDSWNDGVSEWTIRPDRLLWSSGRPWIHFGERIEGNGGCNDFRGLSPGYRFEDGALVPGKVLFTASLCRLDDPDGDAMRSERALQSFLFGRSETGFEVRLWNHGLNMNWYFGAVTMKWFKTDRPTPLPDEVFRQSFDRLSCVPGVVTRQDVSAEGVDPELLLEQIAPDAATVEGWSPFWWARDADGTVVAEIALGDIEPPVFSIYTCGDSR